MTSDKEPHKRNGDCAAAKNADSATDTPKQAPPWADGLKQLYDSVVDEPLPDSFMDLLAQLDDADSSDKTPSDSGKSA